MHKNLSQVKLNINTNCKDTYYGIFKICKTVNNKNTHYGILKNMREQTMDKHKRTKGRRIKILLSK